MNSEESLNCLFCKESFDDKEALKEHFRKHGDPEFNKQTGKFSTRDDQETTDGGQKIVEMVNCDVCSEVFPTISKAITHKHKFHPQHEAKYFCEWCGKLFTLKHLYNKHITSHNALVKGPTTYHCDCCEVDFFKASAMMNHNKFFHRQDTDLPPIGHSKKQKMENQELLQLYYCPFCGEEYCNKVNLHKHTKDEHSDENQSPDEILRCPLCEAMFYHLDAYEVHLTFHSVEDVYTDNTEQSDITDFSLETVPPVLEKVECEKDDMDLSELLGLVNENADSDDVNVERKKHKKKKHKKSKKTITLDEFLNMNSDLFGEGVDVHGIEEVPTKAVTKTLKVRKPNNPKVTKRPELDKLQKQGITIKLKNDKPKPNSPYLTKPLKIRDNSLQGKTQIEKTSSDDVISRLMNRNQLMISKKPAPAQSSDNNDGKVGDDLNMAESKVDDSKSTKQVEENEQQSIEDNDNIDAKANIPLKTPQKVAIAKSPAIPQNLSILKHLTVKSLSSDTNSNKTQNVNIVNKPDDVDVNNDSADENDDETSTEPTNGTTDKANSSNDKQKHIDVLKNLGITVKSAPKSDSINTADDNFEESNDLFDDHELVKSKDDHDDDMNENMDIEEAISKTLIKVKGDNNKIEQKIKIANNPNNSSIRSDSENGEHSDHMSDYDSDDNTKNGVQQAVMVNENKPSTQTLTALKTVKNLTIKPVVKPQTSHVNKADKDNSKNEITKHNIQTSPNKKTTVAPTKTVIELKNKIPIKKPSMNTDNVDSEIKNKNTEIAEALKKIGSVTIKTPSKQVFSNNNDNKTEEPEIYCVDDSDSDGYDSGLTAKQNINPPNNQGKRIFIKNSINTFNKEIVKPSTSVAIKQETTEYDSFDEMTDDNEESDTKITDLAQKLMSNKNIVLKNYPKVQPPQNTVKTLAIKPVEQYPIPNDMHEWSDDESEQTNTMQKIQNAGRDSMLKSFQEFDSDDEAQDDINEPNQSDLINKLKSFNKNLNIKQISNNQRTDEAKAIVVKRREPNPQYDSESPSKQRKIDDETIDHPKLRQIIQKPANRQIIKQASNINQQVTTNVKTIQKQTVVEEITTTVTRTIKTINQSNEVTDQVIKINQPRLISPRFSARTLVGQQVRPQGYPSPRMLGPRPRMRQPRPTMPKVSNQAIRVAGGIPTIPMKVKPATNIRQSSESIPSNIKIKSADSDESQTNYSQSNFSQNKSNIKIKSPDETECQTQFNQSNFTQTIKKSETNFNQSNFSQSIRNVSQVQSSVSSHLSKLNTISGLKIVKSSREMNIEKCEVSNNALSAIQKLQRQGLVIKKPRIEEAEDNWGSESDEEQNSMLAIESG